MTSLSNIAEWSEIRRKIDQANSISQLREIMVECVNNDQFDMFVDILKSRYAIYHEILEKAISTYTLLK